ncbi:MAG: hypothetical protein ACK5MA_02180 [Parachlamydiaceae bacterium]
MVNFITSPYTYFSPFEDLYTQTQNQPADPCVTTQEYFGRKTIVMDLSTLIDDRTTTLKIYVYCKKYWTYEDWKYFAQSPKQSLEDAAIGEMVISYEERPLVHRLIKGEMVQLSNGMHWKLNRQ